MPALPTGAGDAAPVPDPPAPTRCALTVNGPLARSVVDAIRQRFDAVVTRDGDRTVLTVDAVDQAAVRAATVMLWDSGHEVLAMAVIPPTAAR